METFKIEVKETLSRIIEIEANSADEAFSKIQDLPPSGARLRRVPT